MDKTKLIWKYFLEQKYKEIKDWIVEHYPELVGVSLLVEPFLLFISFDTDSNIRYYLPIVISIIIAVFWVSVLTICITIKLIRWLKSNWELAKERVNRELQ